MWWFWLLYAIGYLLTWRRVVWMLASEMNYGGSMGGDALLFGVFMGSIITLFWPIVWTVKIMNTVYSKRGEHISSAFMPRHIRREHELKERQRTIEQLERELKIGGR